MSPRRISPAQMQRACDAFNARHKPGDAIEVYPAQIGGRVDTVQVREPGAYVMGGHTAVVQVTGGHGSIALSHVRNQPTPKTFVTAGEALATALQNAGGGQEERS